MSNHVPHEGSVPPNPLRAHKAPLAGLAASFALGILGAHSIRTQVNVPWLLAGAAVCLLLGLILLRAGWERIAVALALAALVPTGFAAGRLYNHRFPRNHVSNLESLGVDTHDAVRLEGRVVSTPYHTGYGTQFDVEARSIESRGKIHSVTGKVRLRLQGAEEFDPSPAEKPSELQYGDTIRTLVRLRRPHIYQNPGSFDFRRWMEDIEDIYWIGVIKNSRLIEKVGHDHGFRVPEYLERARQRLLRGIDDIYPPWSAQGRYGAVLKAVLWGERTSLDSDTIEGFRKTGLYHLLVIAGLHVGLLTMLLGVLLRRFPWRAATKSAVVLGFVVIYASLVEQRAPTLRATLMIAFYLVARLLDRDHSALNSIGCAAFILLYIRPAWLFESGFQLSFGAALLIVGLAVPILERTSEPYRHALLRLDDALLDDFLPPRLAQIRLDLRALVQALRRRFSFFETHPSLSRNIVVAPLRMLVWTANILLFSAVLQLGLLFSMAETFHRVTFAGVGLNALAIPVMTLLLGLALPINLLSVAAPAVAVWPGKLLSLVMAVLFYLTHLPGNTTWLSYRVPEPPSWVAWGFCGAVVLASLGLRFAPALAKVGLVAFAAFIALVALHPFAPRLSEGQMEMTVLDCGQGDSLFLVLPDQTTILVNAGGGRQRGAREGGFQGRRWNPGEDIVSPYLWSRGIKKLDVVMLTNAREDHLGGLGAILGNFQVGEFWAPDNPMTPAYAQALDTVGKRGIPVRVLSAGLTMRRGDTQIHVLWPPQDLPVSPSTPLDMSTVVRICVPGASFLLPGDVARKVEGQLLVSGAPLESTVLRIGDHASKSSSDPAFVARVSPRVAVLSTEFGNLPSPELLQALANIGARIVQTDIAGATTVGWTAGSLSVQTYAHSTETTP